MGLDLFISGTYYEKTGLFKKKGWHCLRQCSDMSLHCRNAATMQRLVAWFVATKAKNVTNHGPNVVPNVTKTDKVDTAPSLLNTIMKTLADKTLTKMSLNI
jgi:hypothetical protein